MRHVHVLLAALLVAAPARTQGVVELIPEDAAAAVFVRDLDALRTKGDRLIDAAKLNLPLRPSQLFAFAYDFLGVQKDVDPKGSAGLLLLRPEKKEQIGFGNFESLLVPVVPFKKRDDIADTFGADRDLLAAGKIAAGKGANFGKFFRATDKRLYMAQDRRTLERVAAAKSVGGAFTDAQRAKFNGADLVVHLGPREWGDFWAPLLSQQEKDLVRDIDPDGAKAVGAFVRALADTRFVTVGATVDDGLGMHFLALLPPDGPGAKLIQKVRSGRSSNLDGLPDGRVVAAQAHAGEGRATAVYAQVLVHFLLKEALASSQLLSAADRATFAGVFEDVWQRLKGSRLAVYLTPDESRLGLFSAVAVLDADDAGKFLRELRTLAKLGAGDKLDLSRPDAKDGVDVAALIRDLAADDYPTRHAAHVRLGLIGEPAMAYLQKHLDAGDFDLETKRRVEKLQETIGRTAAERRKELLAKDVAKSVRPTFTYVPAAETRDGQAVDVVHVKLAGAPEGSAASLKQLLGPDWDKVRLAAVGDRVAVLLGSDVTLFDAAVRNLKENRPGLSDAKVVRAFRKRAPGERQAEFHVDLETLLGLTAANPPMPRRESRLTSFALGLGAHDVSLDLFVPSGDVRSVGGKLLGQ